jgi:GntR family transcriptional regulator, transcriptional repressor for pyruvate dehydrogenase complex
MSSRPSAPPAAAPARLVYERLSDRLATLIGDRIEAGELKPGERLPTEQALAQAHGVSRTVVREAMHQLKSRGMLTSRQGLGVFVAAPPPHHALAFDKGVLDSIEAVIQVREVRRALEGEIAALAAERATRRHVTVLRATLREIDRAVAVGGDGVAEDLAFHRAMAEATGNPQFTRLLEFLQQYLHDAMRVTRGNEARRADFMEAVRKEHRAILDAIAAGDPKAARKRALDHMTRGEQRLEAAGLLPGPRGVGRRDGSS